MTKRQAASSQLIDNLAALPTAADRRQLNSVNLGAMPLGDKAKAALPLRAATLKQQAMIKRQSGKAASGKLVWNQHKSPWPLRFAWLRQSLLDLYAMAQISCIKNSFFQNLSCFRDSFKTEPPFDWRFHPVLAGSIVLNNDTRLEPCRRNRRLAGRPAVGFWSRPLLVCLVSSNILCQNDGYWFTLYPATTVTYRLAQKKIIHVTDSGPRIWMLAVKICYSRWYYPTVKSCHHLAKCQNPCKGVMKAISKNPLDRKMSTQHNE